MSTLPKFSPNHVKFNLTANDNSPIAHIHVGEALNVLEKIPFNSVDLVVTSPPYYGNLRDYGHSDQYGCEPTLDLYINNQVRVFREVYRILKPTGNLWINIGDKYNKCNLIGVPWKLAFALQEDGWILRNDVIWNKPNPVPESMNNRVSRSHEYFFHLTKTKNNFFDYEAIVVPAKSAGLPISNRKNNTPNRKTAGATVNHEKWAEKQRARRAAGLPDVARRKTVWEVSVIPDNNKQYGHIASYPEKLIEPVILSSCPVGGRVLDPYGGSGTSVVVAQKNGRQGYMIELNPNFAQAAKERIEQNGFKVFVHGTKSMQSDCA